MSTSIHELSTSERGLVDREGDITYRVVCYLNLYSSTWSDELYEALLRSFNEYLERVTPLRYVPYVTEMLAKEAVIPLWEAGVNINTIHELLNKVLEVKGHGAHETYIRELRKLLVELLPRLGVSEPEDLIGKCTSEYSEEDCLTGIAVTSLIISTNP
ncbi:MAG: hypothetical protein QXH02_07240 [Desulfurococcaceae archaeon]